VAILQRLDGLQSAPGEKQVSASDARGSWKRLLPSGEPTASRQGAVVAAAGEDSLENLIAAAARPARALRRILPKMRRQCKIG